MTMMRFLTIVTLGLMVLAVGTPAVEAQTETKVFCVDNGHWDDVASWRLDDCDGDIPIAVPDTNDHVIIDGGLTCEADGSGQNSGDLQVESGAVLNISGGHDVQIRGTSGTFICTIDGTINLKDDGASLSVNQNDQLFDGDGKIVGEHSGAEIGLGGNVKLTSQITIEGALSINDGNVFDATFINQGTVNANTSGTLAIILEGLEDSSAGVWKVTASGATLKFDIDHDDADVLSGDFDVSNGTLEIHAPGFETSGVLTFTGGTVDCDGLDTDEVAKFTGTP